MSGGFDQTKEELQRTVREVMRVVLYRRWAFLIPFCAAASAVLISSHRLPREYKANTVFERRSPIPISKVLDRSGPMSIDTMHQSIRYDMLGPDAMAKAAADLGLVKDVQRGADGQLSKSDQLRIKNAGKRLRGMLNMTPLKTGHDLDRIRISARGSDPELVVKLVNQVRDNYFEFSRRKFIGTLVEARAFYQTETDGLRASIDLHEKEIEKLEGDYPYVNQEANRSAGARAVVMEMSRNNMTRRIEEHQRKISRLEAQLAGMPQMKLLPDSSKTYDPSFLQGGADMERERRRLMDYVMQIENEMTKNRIDKGMLPRHPAMQTLERRKEYAMRDLDVLDRKLEGRPPGGQVFSEDAAVVAVQQSERLRLTTDLADTRAALAAAQTQLDEAKGDLSEHERLRNASYEKRTLYKQMVSSLKDERGQLGDVRLNERKLARVLDIDAKDQGIEFIAIEEAHSSRRPVSPKSESILMLAFGVGLAFGACAVFLREFFDHTFHTATSVGFSLGVPVLEGIDEIMLPVDRRRLLLRRLGMVPVAGAFFGVLAISGGLAYLSLEHPQKFKRVVEKATTTWAQVKVLG